MLPEGRQGADQDRQRRRAGRCTCWQRPKSVNDAQKNVLFDKLVRYFGGADAARQDASPLWGLSFKPNTDDMREAPSRVLIAALFAAGAKVRRLRPGRQRRSEARAARRTRRSDLRAQLRIVESADGTRSTGADALVLVTEWKEFRAPDFDLPARQA